MKFLKRLYAWVFGYFWLPCPVCKKMFGGFETSNVGLWESPGYGKCVCKNCVEKAHELNMANFGYTIRNSND